MSPVHVVQLDLYEVPFQFVVAGEQVVKDFDVSMIGESEVADASGFTLFQQEVQHAVVQIAGERRASMPPMPMPCNKR